MVNAGVVSGNSVQEFLVTHFQKHKVSVVIHLCMLIHFGAYWMSWFEFYKTMNRVSPVGRILGVWWGSKGGSDVTVTSPLLSALPS